MANVHYENGKYYVVNTPGFEQFGVNWGNQQLLDTYLKNGNITELSGIGGTQQKQQSPSYQKPQFTPNAFTQSQLAGMGQGATPQWMMDAYTNKIGKMGGNANQPPFGVTQSGFPGMGGKTAPTQGQ